MDQEIQNTLCVMKEKRNEIDNCDKEYRFNDDDVLGSDEEYFITMKMEYYIF